MSSTIKFNKNCEQMVVIIMKNLPHKIRNYYTESKIALGSFCYIYYSTLFCSYVQEFAMATCV